MEKRCLELQNTGKTYSQIAEVLGIKPAKVGVAIRRAVGRSEALLEHEAVTVRAAQVRRIDEVLSVIYGRCVGTDARIVTDRTGRSVTVTDVDYDAIDRMVKLEKLRADLLGTYAPKKIESDNRTTIAIDEQLEKLMSGRANVSIPIAIESGPGTRVIDVEPND